MLLWKRCINSELVILEMNVSLNIRVNCDIPQLMNSACWFRHLMKLSLAMKKLLLLSVRCIDSALSIVEMNVSIFNKQDTLFCIWVSSFLTGIVSSAADMYRYILFAACTAVASAVLDIHGSNIDESVESGPSGEFSIGKAKVKLSCDGSDTPCGRRDTTK